MRIAVWRIAAVLTLFPVAGCAGRWLAVTDPTRQLRDPYPRDYRVTMANDSVVVLHMARMRNDSLVEESGKQTQRDSSVPPRAVALFEIRQVESWQSRGERITGAVALGLVAGCLAVIWAIAHAFSGGT